MTLVTCVEIGVSTFDATATAEAIVPQEASEPTSERTNERAEDAACSAPLTGPSIVQADRGYENIFLGLRPFHVCKK